MSRRAAYRAQLAKLPPLSLDPACLEADRRAKHPRANLAGLISCAARHRRGNPAQARHLLNIARDLRHGESWIWEKPHPLP